MTPVAVARGQRYSLADDDRLARLAVIASALAGHVVVVAPAEPGSPPWTDGQSIFVDPTAAQRATIEAIAAQASLIAAGSLDVAIVKTLTRNRKAAARYLAVEGHRALLANADILPGALASLADTAVAARSHSAAESLRIATGSAPIADAPAHFGVLRPKQLLEVIGRAAKAVNHDTVGHAPRGQGKRELDELDDGELPTGDDDPDLFTSPVGGGGFIGKWLKKLLSSTRAGSSGGGPPGADSPTHRTNSANRGANAVSSSASAATENGADATAGGVTYPEWDVNQKKYRPDWCTVREVEPRIEPAASAAIDDAIAFRRPLARLGMGLHRRHRQAQGDDIDIDAAVALRVEVMAGSVPDEAVYLDSLRRRRDLSVLVLLDVSGSSAEAGTVGKTVHEQQRVAAASLVVALHDLGDRVALYALQLPGPLGGESHSDQTDGRASGQPCPAQAQQRATRGVLTPWRCHPPRKPGAGGARRYLAATTRRALGWPCLRPRLRARIRRCRRAPGADGGPPAGHRLRVPDRRRQRRRGVASQASSAVPHTRWWAALSSSRASSDRCSGRRSAPPKSGGACHDPMLETNICSAIRCQPPQRSGEGKLSGRG